MKTSSSLYLLVVCFLWFAPASVLAQESETLLSNETTYGSIWSLELKNNSIRNEVGSLVGIYWATVVDRSFIFGIGGVANLSHKVTNYGCVQLVAQYIHESDKLLHYGGQLMIGFADVKDYEKPKSGLFDNFMNTGGESFFLIEPRFQAELNLTKSERLLLCVGYCFASGIDSQHRSLQVSRVTNKDLSGVMVTVGIKFGEY